MGGWGMGLLMQEPLVQSSCTFQMVSFKAISGIRSMINIILCSIRFLTVLTEFCVNIKFSTLLCMSSKLTVPSAFRTI